METTHAIRSRLSINSFDASKTVRDDTIRQIVELAAEAPSSFNIQHWRFVAVTRPDDKQRLRSAAYDQPKVSAASAVLIALGDTLAHEHLGAALAPSVAAGIMAQNVADQFVQMASGMYSDKRAAREEAVRSGSLAAMTLMLAAQDLGLATAPMIGFDPAKVCQEFSIPERYVPVMLIALGHAAAGNWPRKPRLGVDTILAMHDGASLPA